MDSVLQELQHPIAEGPMGNSAASRVVKASIAGFC
jgi:hypothetical protein